MSVQTASFFFALLTLAAMAVVFVMALGLVGGRYSTALARLRDWGVDLIGSYALWLAWLVAVVSVLGSLYYSEIVGYLPCNLCWYQRIFIYPLAVILLVAAIRNDGAVRRYVSPLAVIGGLFALYHYLLQMYPQLESPVCGTEVSCVSRWIDEFGFISFPFMSLVGFLLVLLLMGVAGRSSDLVPD